MQFLTSRLIILFSIYFWFTSQCITRHFPEGHPRGSEVTFVPEPLSCHLHQLPPVGDVRLPKSSSHSLCVRAVVVAEVKHGRSKLGRPSKSR